MVTKIASSLLAFTVTLTLSVCILGGLHDYSSKSDPRTKSRVFELLSEDAKIMQATYDKLDSRSDRSATLFVKILQERSATISKMDISRMPSDFQLAWIEYVSVDREWSDFLAGLEGMPNNLDMSEQESIQADKIITRQNAAWDNLKAVADEYDVELKDFGVVTVK